MQQIGWCETGVRVEMVPRLPLRYACDERRLADVMNHVSDTRYLPTVTDVDHIAALGDPVIRNLQITQCYHELSAVMAERTGPGANWCTFATWASKQAGQTIRKEDLERMLESALHTAPATDQAVARVAVSAQHLGAKRGADEIRQSAWDILNPSAAIGRASQAVARGNQKVFEEIGREFARFFSARLHATPFESDAITQFCDELRPGEPPDGQRFLRQAFMHYYQSFFADDARERAELVLLANLEIGFHEQTRLQPEIAEALDAAFADPRQFARRLIKAIFPYRGWLARVRLFLLRLLGGPTPFDAAVDALLATARRQLHLIITEHMMTLGLPHGVRLRLGDDLRAEFPSTLKRIENPDLHALLARIDPTPDSTLDSGAVDWADLRERLHFIADLFRCYHESRDLHEPPFTPDQVAALKAGRRPSGAL